jgi:hypothetical protein
MAKFRATKNPLYLARAFYSVARQGRLHEAAYGVYCRVFHKLCEVKPCPPEQLQPILQSSESLLSTLDIVPRKQILAIFGEHFAVHLLPEDFSCARFEAMVCGQKYLIIGEYGQPGKRIAYITPNSCQLNEYYNGDPAVLHIHTIYKDPDSDTLLITIGDTAKYLDSWALTSDGIAFRGRLRRYLAGHTTIQKVRGEFFMGTDFSGRRNYIEVLKTRKKYFFPEIASRMYTIKCKQCEARYVVCLNRELQCLGGRHALSVFDSETRQFIYCAYHPLKVRWELDRPLHRAAIEERTFIPFSNRAADPFRKP